MKEKNKKKRVRVSLSFCGFGGFKRSETRISNAKNLRMTEIVTLMKVIFIFYDKWFCEK